MKRAYIRVYILACLVLGGLVAFSGCKKTAKEPPPTEIDGVKLDITKFAQGFYGANPDMQRAVNNIHMNIRYGQYVQALAGLDKLSNDPTLTDKQKQLVNDLLGQVKQLAAKPPATPQ